MRIDVLSCPAPLGPLQGQSLVPQASLIPPVLFPGHLGAVAVPQCQCPVAPGPSSPRLSLKSCREEEWAGACAVPSWCQCTTRVPTNTLLLVPAGAQTEPAQPFHYGAIADWSSGCISCSSFIPSKDERLVLAAALHGVEVVSPCLDGSCMEKEKFPGPVVAPSPLPPAHACRERPQGAGALQILHPSTAAATPSVSASHSSPSAQVFTGLSRLFI